MTPFVDRMVRAAKLDVHVYEEVEADKNALGQAMGVVVLSSVANGVGLIERGGLEGIVVGTVGALVGWYVWAFLTYFIGTKLLPEPHTHATYNELLRTIGFSSSPGIIRVLAIVPALAPFVFLVAGIWMLVAMVIAVRQALDYRSTFRAVGVCLVGWLVQGVIVAIFLMMVGGVPEPMIEESPPREGLANTGLERDGTVLAGIRGIRRPGTRGTWPAPGSGLAACPKQAIPPPIAEHAAVVGSGSRWSWPEPNRITPVRERCPVMATGTFLVNRRVAGSGAGAHDDLVSLPPASWTGRTRDGLFDDRLRSALPI